jgi:hypothetical protein
MMGDPQKAVSRQRVRILGIKFPSVRFASEDVLIRAVGTPKHDGHKARGQVVIAYVAIELPIAAQRRQIQRY